MSQRVNADLARRALEVAAARRPIHPLDGDDEADDEAGGDELAAVRAGGAADLYLQRWAGRIPSRFVWADLDHVALEHPAAVDDLMEWALDPRGRNLVLLGPVGTGKTYTAVAACRPSAASGAEVQFLPVDELLDLLRPGGPEGAIYDLARIDRLIIDDLGAERATDWTADRLFAVVNRRWLEERPTIVTTNLPADAFAEAVGPRLFSRLVGNDAVTLRLSGGDRRRAR